MPYLSYAKSFKRDSKTEYKAFTQLKQEHSKYTILCSLNIDHISLGKQSITNKYAPKNTQNIGFIRENIELNTLYIIINVLIYSSLNNLFILR